MVLGKGKLLAFWVRLRSILSGRDWIYLSSLLGPVVFFHVGAVLVAATTTGAHLYFQETGSTLDLNMIVYSLSKWGEIEDVVASVASPVSLALVAGVVYYAVMGPLLITRLLCGRRDPSAA